MITATERYSVDCKSRDENYWAKIDQIAQDRDYKYQDILRHWPAYIMRRDMPRFLSHYELFKKVIDMPGCIIDLGVWRGASFFTWAMFLEIFCPYDRSRKVFGFDTFCGLQEFNEKDGAMDITVQKNIAGYSATQKEIETLIDIHNSDNVIPGTKRAHLVVGDVAESIPPFLEENPGLKISLLHFDMDLYKPTKAALELLYPLVLDGGVVCFDEYGLIPWQGETKAVDEYFASIDKKPLMKKHPFAQTPHAYFIK